MGNSIVHWEVMGGDGAELAKFYNGLFDWEATETPGFEAYYLVDADKTGVGGAVGKAPEGMPAYLTMYIEVDDINDHLARIESAGGSTLMPRTEIPGTVTFALFADPAGNTVGLVEPETPPAK
jgi:predicted enzyme related to lactoylglutathione lyase